MARNIVVTGSRKWKSHGPIRFALTALAERDPNAVVHHGGAPGADRICAKIAAELGLEVVEHPADWEAEPKRGGFIRNLAMLDVAEPTAVYGFWLNKSGGTRHCLVNAYRRGVPVAIWEAPQDNSFRKFVKS